VPIAEDPEPRPSDGPQDDPFEGLVLDEEFVRAATVKEQSGRARMLAAKWKREPPEPTWPELPTPPRKRRGFRARIGRRWQTWLIVACVCGLALLGLRLGDNGRTAPPQPVRTPGSASPSAPPSAAPGTPTADHPWDGSPALSWPDGAAGITLPEAKAVGVFDKDEVAAQLKAVKDFLVLANVDPKTVAGGTPQAALDLLNVNSRQLVEKALAAPSVDHDPTGYLSRFNPRLAIPVTDTVKVHGKVTFEENGEKGMVVHTDVTFVYALRPGPDIGKSPGASPRGTAPAGGGSGGAKPVSWSAGQDTSVEREIVRRVQDFRFDNPARYDVNPRKLSFGEGYSDFGNNVCEMGSGFLETAFPLPGSGTEKPGDGTMTDPYDYDKPLEKRSGCGTVSRS